MLSGTNVVFIGGDARQLEVIKKFIQLNATVTLIGFDNLQEDFSEVKKDTLQEKILGKADAVVLPIVGTDDDGFVENVFGSTPIQLLEKHFAVLKKQTVIYTGISKTYLDYFTNKYNLKVVPLLNRDDVAIYNSIPTAEGALMMAVQNTDITIHGSTCAVLGFGRTGITMARTLKGLGARVRVGARRAEHIARIYEMGFYPFTTDNLLSHVNDVDILFNTIPSKIITKDVISRLPQNSVIIDLASSPGGTDFKYAEEKGIKALLAPGLPGIVAPKTAGQIIADTLSRLVLNQKGNQEE